MNETGGVLHLTGKIKRFFAGVLFGRGGAARRSVVLCALIGSFLLVTSGFGASQIRCVVLNNLRYVYLKDVAAYYGMTYYANDKDCRLVSKSYKMEFVADKKKAEFNGIGVNCLNPVVKSGADILISEQDLLLLIEPVLNYKALTTHKMRLIMLDPGHGDQDKGGSGRIYQEKDLVLQIALRLRDKLSDKGYLVAMTRNKDIFIPLEQRAAMCESQRADLFVAIHANKAANPEITGVETFCMTPSGASSTYDSKPSYRKEKGNTLDRNNFRLAFEVHKAILAKTGAFDRGVKHARFLVLRNVSCPAILIETGFLSNAVEERALGRQSYQDSLATAIAEGVLNYHKELRKN